MALAVMLAGCALQEPSPAPAPQASAAPMSPQAAQATRHAEQAKLEAQARAMLAQAETDVQRARAKRALWLGAWEDLLAARNDVAGNDFTGAIAHAKGASELAQLGLEQLAYPAVK
ncbi:MAG TPA: hypothetical protein VFJ86_05460 [Usitatibacter sp.]|nr:hypothetical protein [Usitatibacter sp.]